MILTEGVEKGDVAVQSQGVAERGREEFGVREVQSSSSRKSRQGIRGHMEERQYELIFICRPDTPEADIDKVIATLEHAATEKGAQDREDRQVGPQAHGLPRAAAARGILRVHGAAIEPRRSGQGTRAPAEGGRPGDQVSDRARGRGIEAAGKIEAAPRTPRRAASAQDRVRRRSTGCRAAPARRAAANRPQHLKI